MNLGLYSYTAAAIAYGFFFVLLLFSWRGSLQGKLLVVAIGVSTAWAIISTTISLNYSSFYSTYQALEILRYITWYIFLIKLFDTAETTNPGYRQFAHRALLICVGFASFLLVNEIFVISDSPMPGLIGHMFLALAGLAIIEQLLRNTSIRHRWAIKYLFIGAGGIFAFDFYLYAEAFLFRAINHELWETRGIIHFVAVPLLVIASARNKNWSLNIFVSRDIVLNTTAIFGGGIYLLIMAATGYYLREVGGSWGRLNQAVFFSLAVALLASVLFSGHLRAQLRVFLGKHFYKNKYDYRREWLNLTDKLSNKSQPQDRYELVITALANAVDARGGGLWLRDEQSGYRNVAVWNVDSVNTTETDIDSLIRFMNDRGYIINLTEIESHADEYQNLKLPQWINKLARPWLIVPLFGLESLIGFIVLTNPLVSRQINWEDRDLLKTAARQISSHLTVLMTSEALTEAKQFEVFTRLSAYMVHDLKNIATELEMVARNASKHMSNPAFVEDAFETVENAAGDIKRLLEQLRNRQVQDEKKTLVNLVDFLEHVIQNKQNQHPVPRLGVRHHDCFVIAERDRLYNVLGHLIDNAQQATDDDGQIEIILHSENNMHIIDIKDDGCGMETTFIQNRLFKPFDTTKGNAGMGIGMYESREFVRLLDGDIYVHSTPGKGTTISLHIPSAQAPESSASMHVDTVNTEIILNHYGQ